MMLDALSRAGEVAVSFVCDEAKHLFLGVLDITNADFDKFAELLDSIVGVADCLRFFLAGVQFLGEHFVQRSVVARKV